jgi:hypothetical protein
MTFNLILYIKVTMSGEARDWGGQHGWGWGGGGGGGRGGEGPPPHGRGELDGCIMHRVHTSNSLKA